MCNPFSAPDAVCAKDRAFMPNPATESDGATRGQMQALIATAPTNVLPAIGGGVAARTPCSWYNPSSRRTKEPLKHNNPRVGIQPGSGQASITRDE